MQGSLFKKNIHISSNFNQKDSAVITDDISKLVDKMPRNFFRLIISSPPYNIGKDYEKKQKLQDYMDWQEGIMVKLVNLLHPKGSFCWQTGNFVDKGEIYPLDMYFYPLFKKLGLKLRNRIIWHFNHGLHASKRLSGRYETLLWFTKSDNYIFNLDSIRQNILGKGISRESTRDFPAETPRGKIRPTTGN